MNDFLPVSRPHFFGREMDYVEQALRSTRISGAGAFVDRMEAMVAAAAGAGHAVAVSSGTSALDLGTAKAQAAWKSTSTRKPCNCHS